MSHYANGDLTTGTMTKAMEGISIPHLIDIPRGTVLYRFVDIKKGPHQAQANSPWWMEYEYFQKIKHFGLQHGYDLDYCARLFAAIRYEYSEITGYVSAAMTKPLKAWKGEGKPVSGSKKDSRDPDLMIPMQSINKIYQLYIPGFGRGMGLFDTVAERLNYTRIK